MQIFCTINPFKNTFAHKRSSSILLRDLFEIQLRRWCFKADEMRLLHLIVIITFLVSWHGREEI